MTTEKIIIKTMLAILFTFSSLAARTNNNNVITGTKTQEEQSAISPWQALQKLKAGNQRFLKGTMRQRDLVAQVASSKSQYPFAIILGCMDSRGSPEIIFDQGIGDIFSERLAGNIINTDVLGGMEFGTKISGAKLIAVIGHTACAAIKGACQHVELGNLTALLDKIKPSVSLIQAITTDQTCDDQMVLDKISKQNVLNAIEEIKKNSPIIMSLIKEGKIGLVGGMHNVSTGEVTFFEDQTLLPGGDRLRK